MPAQAKALSRKNTSTVSGTAAKKPRASTDPVAKLELAREKLLKRSSSALRVLADDRKTPADILSFLSGAALSDIRARVAANSSASAKTDMVLVADPKVSVRAALAAKLGAFNLSGSTAGKGSANAVRLSMVDRLLDDDKARVRRSLARALAANENAPRELLLRLARDLDAKVHGPVVRQSAALTTRDLAALMNKRDDTSFFAQIASREHIDETICWRLIAADDEATVTVLINNHSAALSDEMISQLADRAATITPWRTALAGRPGLSRRLLKKPSARPDTPHPSGDAVVSLPDIANKSDNGSGHVKAPAITESLEGYEAIFSGLERHLATRMAEGTLTEASIAEAASLGQHANVWVALSLLTGASISVVHKIMANKAPRTIMALAWHAGLSPETAVILQRCTAKIARDHCTLIKQPGTYPLDAGLMSWLLTAFNVDDRTQEGKYKDQGVERRRIAN